MVGFCVYCGTKRPVEEGAVCARCGNPPLRDGEEEEPYRAPFALLSDPCGPKAPMVYGFVERFRGKHVHTFHLYKEGDHSFVLACSMSSLQSGALHFHTKQSLFNNYEATMGMVPQSLSHPDFIASLMPNSLLGTEFLLTNSHRSAVKPRSTTATGGEETGSLLEQSSVTSAPKEFALVRFSTNLAGTSPNQCRVYVRANPRSSKCKLATLRQRARQVSQTRAPTDLAAILMQRLQKLANSTPSTSTVTEPLFFYNALEEGGEEGEDRDEVLVYQNRKPAWNAAVGGWTLDFNARVLIRSKKNFILVPSNTANADNAGNEAIGVRFGKHTKHRFNLDYRYPFSPLSALAVSMSMFASKLVVAW
ncbi:hypothetical protein BASA81_004474 [Batrachochytrium salamandrivorans]|nr:hypothetical protein BASA81_004474 [Batrachochytrium salamandrivorans]